MSRVFDVAGVVLLVLLTWIHYIGFAFLEKDVIRNLPKDVRNNPGTYRSVYRTHTFYGGGK